jgi:protein-disulfide isomerase
MPSGKRSRQKRTTAPPPVRSKGAPRSRAGSARNASPRVIGIAAVVVVAVIVAVVLAVVLGGGKSNSIPKGLPAVGSVQAGLPGSAAVVSEFKGIPQTGTTLGKPSAPVTMVEFIDLQCPYCDEFETETFPGLVSKYVRSGQVKVVMEPWAFIGPDSITGQAAVLAAGQQNKAFDYAAILYDNQGTENTGWLDSAMVANAAASVPGLKVQQLLSQRSSSSVKSAAKQVDTDATKDSVSGTPTLFVGKSGTLGKQVTLSSPTDRAAIVAAIGKALGT